MEEEKVVIKLHKELLESERKEKKQKTLRKVLIVLLCLMCLLSGTFLGIFISKKSKGIADVVVTNDKYDRIATYMNGIWLYGNEVEDLDRVMADNSYYGMVNFSDDKYTTYFSAQDAKDFASSINGDYVGIGCQFTNINGIGLITRVFKDSPAEEAGLMAGDFIYEVDGKSAIDLTSDEIKNMVQGEEGSFVDVKVLRGNNYLTLHIQRRKVNFTAYAYTQDDYVVLDLLSFGENTADEIVSYLKDYKDYSKIIIDVRGNGGGYESALLEVCGLFIGPNKLVLKEIDKDGDEKDCYSSTNSYFDNFKSIVLLTDSDTASAAEVFTIALKELHEDCTQIGLTTFGKGVVQATLPLGDGSYLKVTRSYWQSPNGQTFNGEGIKPDVEVYLHDLMYERMPLFEKEESYKYDDVNQKVRICQLALDFLGYDVDRFDGYFDKKTAEELNKFKSDYNLNTDEILDYDTYLSLISISRSETYLNKQKDNQWLKAVEIIENK